MNTYRNMTPIRTTARIVLAIFLLAGLPFVAVSAHTQLQPSQKYFGLTLSPHNPPDLVGSTASHPLIFNSALTPLKMDLLAGDNKFEIGDLAYVHASVSSGHIAYAFAVNRDNVLSEERPYAVTLRGTVAHIDGDILHITYPFDSALVAASEDKNTTFDVKLQISKNGVARLVNLPQSF